MNHEEGTRLHIPLKPKNLIATVLIALTLVVSLYPLLPVHAAVTALTVTPTSGIVGQSIAVNGTIETQNKGFYIFFDSTRVRNGTASLNSFSTTFVVPQATNGTHLITLQDATTNSTDTKNFTVKTSYAVTPFNLPTAPNQLQEGDSVQIKAQIFGGNPSAPYQRNVTVTIPTGAVFTNLTSFTTNQTGTAETILRYPTDFAPAARNTNYTDTYRIKIFQNVSALGGQSSFFVGLTNATTYHRFDWVNIKATNYTKTNEYANVTIAFGGKKVNQTRIPALNGEVIYNWKVPANASMGTYTVTVKTLNSTGTVKSVPDVQNFTVPGFPVSFKTLNLNLEGVANINATVYQIDPFNASKKVQAATGYTNSSGWVVYTLERGDYTLNAFLKNVLVNRTNLIKVENRSSWTLVCNLTRIAVTAFDGKTGLPLPFIIFVLNSTFRTVLNTLQNDTQSVITNTTATWTLNNQLLTANYTISAYRARSPFNTTHFQIPPATKTFNLSITCPVLALTIHAEDASQASMSGYPIKLYEYAGGLYDNAVTDSNGNVTFTAAFGQYRIRLYNPAQTIVLNETLFALVNASSLLLHSSIFNANLSVQVVGYLGQPIPNARVKIEREDVAPMEVDTNGNGVAFFGDVIGGDTFVSVYVGGDMPSDTANVYVAGNTAVTISLGEFVSVFGLLMDTSQFAVLLTFIVFIVVFALFIIYRQRRKPKPSTMPAEKS